MPAAPASPALLALLQPSSSQMIPTLLMYAAIGAIFYFLLIRPQQQQRRKHDETIRGIKKGDEVVTAGGIVGEVVAIRQWNADAPGQEDRVTIRSGESRLVVERGRIARITTTPAQGSTAAPTAPGA